MCQSVGKQLIAGEWRVPLVQNKQLLRIICDCPVLFYTLGSFVFQRGRNKFRDWNTLVDHEWGRKLAAVAVRNKQAWKERRSPSRQTVELVSTHAGLWESTYSAFRVPFPCCMPIFDHNYTRNALFNDMVCWSMTPLRQNKHYAGDSTNIQIAGFDYSKQLAFFPSSPFISLLSFLALRWWQHFCVDIQIIAMNSAAVSICATSFQSFVILKSLTNVDLPRRLALTITPWKRPFVDLVENAIVYWWLKGCWFYC